MNDLDDIDALAAEYVLGTLTAAERDGVTMLRVHEPALDAAIVAWEHRLGPMIALVAETSPPPHLLDRIRAQIKPTGSVIDFKPREAALTRRAHSWRNAAIAMTALAASFAGVLGWREAVRTPMASTYVAVLQAGKTSPALLLTVDTARQMFAVRALSKPPEQGKTYELWLVHDKLAQPKSLGVVPDGDMAMHAVNDSGVDRSLFMDATFAVSLEPVGGSPTGQPTGPVLFTGKLYQTTP